MPKFAGSGRSFHRYGCTPRSFRASLESVTVRRLARMDSFSSDIDFSVRFGELNRGGRATRGAALAQIQVIGLSG
jgi:hypothetical protein